MDGRFIGLRAHQSKGRRRILKSIQLGKTAREPADAALARVTRGRLVGLPGNDVIELHDHVRAEVALDLHHELGREKSLRAIDVTLELDAVFAERPELREGKDLKPARIGEDRT